MSKTKISYKFLFNDLPPVISPFDTKLKARLYCKANKCTEIHQLTDGKWFKIKKTG